MRVQRALAVALGLLLSVGVFACDRNTREEAREATAETPASDARPGQRRGEKEREIIRHLPDVVDKAMPGVVGISTERVVQARPSPFPFMPGQPFGRQPPQERRQRGIGSGVLVDDKGTILTNHHVVQGADEIRVAVSERRDNFEASIVATDKATDLAVVRMKNPPEDLKPLPFGDSTKLRLGEPVVAIGQPFGLSGTVTYGIVSAKGRQDVGLAEYEDFIQTDAAINPGNSGGALVDMQGRVIGINTAILSRTGGYQGIGFAIPSSMAKKVMQQLIEDGEVKRGYLGVLIQTLTPELAEAFGLPSETQGVVVADVEDDSPAAEGGLQQGDVVVAFKGKEIRSASNLRLMVAHTAPGTTVEMTVRRDGERQTLEVELGKAAAADDGQLELEAMGLLQGLQLGPVDREAHERFNLPDRLNRGLVIRDIARGSPAAQTELRPGDVLLEVNRKALESVDQLTEAYKQADQRILLLVYRDGNTFFMPIPKVGGR